MMTIPRALLLSAVLTGTPILVQGSDWLQQFEANCRGKGGKPVHNPGGGGYCDFSGTATGGMSPGAAGAAMANDFGNLLRSIDAQNEAVAKQRKAAMMQALENERQDALRRQDAARAANLAAIQQRLVNSDLGMKTATGDSGGLQLKLGGAASGEKPAQYGLPGRHVFRNDIFTPKAEPTPTETIAADLLTLKLGDDATRSLRNQPAKGAVAQTIPGAAPAGDGGLSPPLAQAVESFSRMKPEDQRKLLDELSAAAAAPSRAPVEPASPGPQRDGPNAPPESVKSEAESQFNVGASTTVAPARAAPRATPLAGPPAAAPAAPTAPTRASPSTTTPAPRAPKTAPPVQVAAASSAAPAPAAPARIQAPTDSDLALLFHDQPGFKTSAQRRREAAEMAILGVTLMPDESFTVAGPNQRRALVGYFAPELMQTYESDARVAARIDLLIDIRVADVRRWRAEQDRASGGAENARRANADEARALLRRYLELGFEPLRQ